MKYNENLVNEIIEKFKSKGYKPSDITIYFDMDNVLCLFSVFGDEDIAVKRMFHKGFYKELPCFPEAPAVIENLQRMGFKVKIISACIDSPYCRPEKELWLHYHLPTLTEVTIILVNKGENKADYITDIERAILIDDFYQNIVDFYAAGGVAIKKTYSGKIRPIPQVESLVDIFSILYSLNCL